MVDSGRALYHWLFSPAPEPDPEDDTMQDDNPRRRDETIFAKLVAECVDIRSSFLDPLRLSAPQVPSDDTPVTTFPPTTLPIPAFDPLVRHIYSQFHPFLSRLRADGTILTAHVTFIVGPPDHPNARYSLHSHLVGCFTAAYGHGDESHSVLYVPTGPGQAWNGPEEWGPVMVYLAVSLLWPDLSYLVVSPSYLLGAHASCEELKEIFLTAAPLILFSSATSLLRDDILYHPGVTSKFAHEPPFTCTDPPFCHFTPDEVATTITDTLNRHLAESATWRERIQPNTIEADQHFPLLCTPYYGFIADTNLDTTVALLQLSNFLMACCYTSSGAPHTLHNIDDTPPCPYELLSLFSCLPAALPGGKIEVFPGTGVFIYDPSSVPSPGIPKEMSWFVFNSPSSHQTLLHHTPNLHSSL